MIKEEKSKAYDEAIKKAKSEYSKFKGMLPGNVLEDVFPELKESEDEKIRKGIIKSINDLSTDWLELHGITKGDALAWLKKQNNKVIDCPQNHKDMNNPNGCIVLEDFNGGNGFYKVHLDYLNKKQVEEVEEMVRDWNKECKELRKFPTPADVGFEELGKAWAEETKDKKSAWSEEDEKMLNDAIGAIDIADYYTYDDKQEIENWLKSLKERYTWKPSEEQIEALNEVIRNLYLSTAKYNGLVALREQLKVL